MRLIKKLASEIAGHIIPPVERDNMTIVSGRKIEIELLLIEFANEIKREALEP